MKNLILTVFLFTLSSSLFAVPFTFEAGKPARASEVNDNFNSLDSAIDDLQGDLFTLNLFATGTSNDLSSLSSTVSTQGSNLSTLSTTVSGHTTSITSIQNSISAINTDLSSAEAAIGTLESETADLDTRVTTLEDAPAGEACLTLSPHSSPNGEMLTYSYQAATPGQVITIDSIDYTIVKIPVKNLDTGITYIVTAPFNSINGTLTTVQVEDKCFGNMTISGFPAQLEMYEFVTYEINSSGNGLVTSSSQGFTENLWIKIGSLVLLIKTPEPVSSNFYSFNLTDNNYDGSAVDTSGIARDTTFINNVDTFIDYIKIEEVE